MDMLGVDEGLKTAFLLRITSEMVPRFTKRSIVSKQY